MKVYLPETSCNKCYDINMKYLSPVYYELPPVECTNNVNSDSHDFMRPLKCDYVLILNLLWCEFVETMRDVLIGRYMGQVTVNLCVINICGSRSKRRSSFQQSRSKDSLTLIYHFDSWSHEQYFPYVLLDIYFSSRATQNVRCMRIMAGCWTASSSVMSTFLLAL